MGCQKKPGSLFLDHVPKKSPKKSSFFGVRSAFSNGKPKGISAVPGFVAVQRVPATLVAGGKSGRRRDDFFWQMARSINMIGTNMYIYN